MVAYTLSNSLIASCRLNPSTVSMTMIFSPFKIHKYTRKMKEKTIIVNANLDFAIISILTAKVDA